MSTYLISVAIPVYNEAKQIYENINIIHKILTENNINHEFILVDDGSRDNTWKELKRLSSDLPNVFAFKFSRNFGKEAALCAALEAVNGDACVVMDSDLQHPPEIIPQMVRLWKEEGYDVVEAVKSSRGKESIINKIGAHFFYSILKNLSGFNLDGASDFKLLDAKVVNSWNTMQERNTFFRGMSAWLGYKRTTIPFEVVDRKEGKSKWSTLKLFKLAITAITSFTSLPLQLVTLMGMLFLFGSFILGIYTLYMKFKGMAVSGFTTVILLLLIIGSTLMISLGIIGTYIAKIFDEVKFRPRFIVSEKAISEKIEHKNISANS
ncbi:glycosyltransferase family 2 protein [Acetivibrio mesophilus]|uniref:Glycosyltransferase n=1 Tax=Acetivibrio mesophilus TaxID=2487273 RepID=A0A4Q0I1W7_9FIRM|nr:glycosyltransferase family 2 protein [Acetivibrio mesophilus]ODM27892.1 glycosyl transferase [Clostridium sp. Bc-iso-3]RXE57667.1 glycosyltransferase [Acetivibrio mesophilus]HHV28750.1 glycosyltransferase family 2 protein [Clostridium sp.]